MSWGVPIHERMLPHSSTPATEQRAPNASAMPMAVCMPTESLCCSWAPKYCATTMLKPTPIPTENPTTRSVRAEVAWTAATAVVLPEECPTTNTLISEYACWKKDEKNTGRHSLSSCFQMTPWVTSRDLEAAFATLFSTSWFGGCSIGCGALQVA